MQPEEKQTKILVLMRGVPGSGKSTLAKKIAGVNGLVYSTDDFFYKNGVYQYDASLIGKYHQQNFKRTVKAMQQSKPLIIIDNTNIKLWEMRKYVQQADKYQYQVKVQKSVTDWAWNAKQCSKKNSHGVGRDIIERMIDNFEQFEGLDDIRNAKDNRRRNNNK